MIFRVNLRWVSFQIHCFKDTVNGVERLLSFVVAVSCSGQVKGAGASAILDERATENGSIDDKLFLRGKNTKL